MEYAKSKGAITIAFCGYKGGKIINMADLIIHSKAFDMEIAEDIHMIVFNVIKKEIQRRLFSNDLHNGEIYDKRVK